MEIICRKKFIEKILENKRSLLIGIVILIVIFLIYILFFKDDDKTFLFIRSDSSEIRKEYEKLNNSFTKNEKKYPEVKISNNKFEYTNIDDVIDIFNNKGDAVIYLGYSSCLYCRTAIQVLYDISIDTEIGKMLYLDVEEKEYTII